MDVVFFSWDVFCFTYDGVSSIAQCPDHPEFMNKGMMGVKLQVVISVRCFAINCRGEVTVVMDTDQTIKNRLSHDLTQRVIIIIILMKLNRC